MKKVRNLSLILALVSFLSVHGYADHEGKKIPKKMPKAFFNTCLHCHKWEGKYWLERGHLTQRVDIDLSNRKTLKRVSIMTPTGLEKYVLNVVIMLTPHETLDEYTLRVNKALSFYYGYALGYTRASEAKEKEE